MKKLIKRIFRGKYYKNGESYVDTIVKVIICVVVGALLLTSVYAVAKSGIESAKNRVNDLLDYNPNGEDGPGGGDTSIPGGGDESEEELVILTAPTISIDNSILTIINNDENTTSFDIYIDGVYATNVIKTAETGGQITDLTGTKWQLNIFANPVLYLGGGSKAINFISAGINFTTFRYDSYHGGDASLVYYVGTNTYKAFFNDCNAYDWEVRWYNLNETEVGYDNSQFKIIEITGGADATDAAFISWLQDDATQLLVDTTIDISTLSLGSGTHNITVKAKAIGYEDSVASNAVSYIVATAPTIDTQPQGATYNIGATPTALSIAASTTDGGTLTYQWYKSEDVGSTWVALSGATNNTYMPDTSAVSSFMYRCIVTNTLNGTTANTTSSAATITVTAASGYSVTFSAIIGTFGSTNQSLCIKANTPPTSESDYDVEMYALDYGNGPVVNPSSLSNVSVLYVWKGYPSGVTNPDTSNGTIWFDINGIAYNAPKGYANAISINLQSNSSLLTYLDTYE